MASPRCDPVAEVLANQHLLKCHAAVQFNDFLKAHAFEPFAIEDDSGAFPAQDLEGLILIALRVFQDLFMRQLGTRDRSAAGIANHGGEVADDQYRGVTQILKISELFQHDAVSEMNVGCGRINPKFDIEGPALVEFG